tara:strand:+ start:203 stop:835 length:633 start_codon:yes stop_codon:yes gene_type:complete
MKKPNKPKITFDIPSVNMGLAILGGSFDPVHYGHLKIAEAALGFEKVDHLVFIPSSKSPLKSRNPKIESSDRVNMLKLASNQIFNCSIDLNEINRGGISYTADTIKFYREYCRGDLFWILGSDQFLQLHKWYKVSYLIKELIFLVYPRSGFPIEASPILKEPSLRYHSFNVPEINISSTIIRELSIANDSISQLVPESVAEYINKHQLYL